MYSAISGALGTLLKAPDKSGRLDRQASVDKRLPMPDTLSNVTGLCLLAY